MATARKCAQIAEDSDVSIHNEKCPKCGHTFEPDLAHPYDDLVNELRELRAVARAAKKNPCRHSADETGDNCPVCIALSTLSPATRAGLAGADDGT